MRSMITKRKVSGRKAASAALLVIAALFGSGISVLAQPSQPADMWEPWRFLLGQWVGGGGQPDQGSGSFSFDLDLQGEILVRKNHADIPASKDRPAAIHDDLMVVYQEPQKPTRAIYFDSEGHTIHYTAEFSKAKDALTFLSDVAAGAPRFRLTYAKTGKDSVNIAFDIAPPGQPEAFSPYLQGSAHKK